MGASAKRRPRLALRTFQGLERLDTLTRDDPLPAVAEGSELLKRGLRTVALRIAARGLPRRLLGARARRPLRRAGSVVFLCRGNICRSPFAAAVVREHRPRARIASVGSFPCAGRPAPPEAVAAATECGVDLSDHRSRVADPTALRKADAVFVFDHRDWATAIRALWGEPPPAALCRQSRSRRAAGGRRPLGPWRRDLFGRPTLDFAAPSTPPSCQAADRLRRWVAYATADSAAHPS